MRFRKKAVAAAAGLLIASGISLGVVGSASASIPDSSGIIHACYTTSSGALRVIDPGSGDSCYSYETSLSWPASGLQYFDGSSATSGDYLAVTCPDGGIPSGLWVQDGYESSNYYGPGGDSEPYLDFTGGSSSQPDGITTDVGAAGTYSYVLICS